MSLTETIKGPKTLTFKHWRYRLLHWCFGVDPLSPKDSPLPAFMYTHYCPLFHVTNLIVLFLPLILVIQLLLVLFGACAAVLALFSQAAVALWGALTATLPERKPKQKKSPKPPKPLTDAQQRRLDIGLIYKMVAQGRISFAPLWREWSYKFLILDQDEVKEIHAKIVAEIQAEREHRDQKEKAWRDFFVKMAAFSQVLIKCLLYVLYAAMGAGLVAGLYYGTLPLLSFIYSVVVWLGESWTLFCAWVSDTFTLEVVTAILMWGGCILMGMVTILLFVLAAFKIRLGTAIASGVTITVEVFLPYFMFLGRGVAWPIVGVCKVVKGFFKGVCEFVAVFYEENCPPITIVEED